MDHGGFDDDGSRFDQHGVPLNSQTDPDGDGISVLSDTDNDNDGLHTWEDDDDTSAFVTTAHPDGLGDSDGDGVPDEDDDYPNNAFLQNRSEGDEFEPGGHRVENPGVCCGSIFD